MPNCPKLPAPHTNSWFAGLVCSGGAGTSLIMVAADVVFAAVPLVFVSWVVADFLRPSGFRAGFVAVFDGAEASPLSDWLFVRFTGLFSTSSSSSATGDRGRLPFLLATFEAGAFSTAFDAGAFPFAFDAGAFPLALGAGALETGFAAAAFDAGLDAGAFEEGLEAAFFALTILSSTVESGFPREDLRVRPAMFCGSFGRDRVVGDDGKRQACVRSLAGFVRRPLVA